ncbi:hypothetical protein LOD99_4757 [Oopsacas minuta]|uniref:Transposase Tc1-like domain-containing protein n=1 Tax=Oopsacas minuta TaxID=111878 RepID=A0AAV7JT00_9METZ|nr:hypothetical protein LOD99_4757 [Oopsacas minuta]
MFIHRTIQQYTETGDMEDRARSGRPVTVRTRHLREIVRTRITLNPRRSMRKLAREYQVSRETVRKVAHKYLGLKSLKRRKLHHLNPALVRRGLTDARGCYSACT